MPVHRFAVSPETHSGQKLAEKKARSYTPTFGEVFSDGALIELLQAGKPPDTRHELMLSAAGHCTVAPVLNFRGRFYQPTESPLLSVVALPTRCAPFGSTGKLFRAVRDLFLGRGFSEAVVFPLPYFVFASWFTDILPGAPCLLIDGPPREGQLLLQVLQCMVRRPLRIGQFTKAVLGAVPAGLYPTMLISQRRLGNSAWDLLGVSNQSGAHIVGKGGLLDPFCAKAIHTEEAEEHDVLNHGIIQISCPPMRGQFQLLMRRRNTHWLRSSRQNSWRIAARTCRAFNHPIAIFRNLILLSGFSRGSWEHPLSTPLNCKRTWGHFYAE